MPLKKETTSKTPSKPSKIAQKGTGKLGPKESPKKPKRHARKRIQDKVSPEAPQPTINEILQDDKEYLFLDGFPDLNVHQKRFLLAFSVICNLTESAEVSRVSRQSHYVWMEKETYREAFAIAREVAVDRLEGVIWRRAKLVSDSLAVTIIKAYKPEVYNPPQQYRHKTESTIAANIGGNPENPLLVKQDNGLWDKLSLTTKQAILKDLEAAGVKDD